MADYFSEAVTRRYGVTCLHLLLSHKAAAELTLNHAEPDGTLTEVPAALPSVPEVLLLMPQTQRMEQAPAVGQASEA